MSNETDASALVEKLRELESLTAVAQNFGETLTNGLRSAIVEGKSLESVLDKIMLRLSDRVLDVAMKPLSGLIDGLIGSLTGGLAEGAGATAPKAGADMAPKITVNIATPDAESFRRSEAQVSAMLTRAVGRGRRGL